MTIGDGTSHGTEHSIVEISLLHNGGSASLGRPPTIESIAPNQISSEGGDTVRLIGKSLDFMPDGSTIYVEFGSKTSVIAEVVSSNEIVCIAPPAWPGSSSHKSTRGYFVLVRVTNLVDFWSNAVQLFIETPVQAVYISPDAGPACGGTVVSVLGRKFLPSPSLVCVFGEGDMAITVHANWRSAQELECTSPSWRLPDGTRETNVPFALISGGVRSLLSFRFTQPILVTSISPGSGPGERDTVVVVNGSNFNRYDLVCVIGGQRVPTVIESDDRLRCLVPPRSSLPGHYFKIKVVMEGAPAGNDTSSMRYELGGVNASTTSNKSSEMSTEFESKPAVLRLVRGRQYWLDQTDDSNSGHPIALSANPGGVHSPGGRSWTRGVKRLPSFVAPLADGSVNVSAGAGVLRFSVPFDAPDVLHVFSEKSAFVKSDIQITVTNDMVHTSVEIIAACGSSCNPTGKPFRYVDRPLCQLMR